MDGFVVIERGLTFFECIARCVSINKSHLTALEIHDQLVMHFAHIVFNETERCHSIMECIDSGSQLTLKASGVLHSAIKRWALKIHSQEKSVSRAPEVWYTEYPKFYKGAALRFLYYHRNYRDKPHRLFCKYVFAHLASDYFFCRVGIFPGTGAADLTAVCKWIYPLDCEDYMSDVLLNSVVIKQETKEQFTLISEPSLIDITDSIPCLLSTDKMYFEEEHNTLYQLRRYSVLSTVDTEPRKHVNNIVGSFEKCGTHVHVLEVTITKNEDKEEDVTYLIYPSDPGKSMFVFLKDEIMYVFYVVKKNDDLVAICCCENLHHDIYPYFQLKPQVVSVVVVMAKTQEEAKRFVTAQTAFSIF